MMRIVLSLFSLMLLLSGCGSSLSIKRVTYFDPGHVMGEIRSAKSGLPMKGFACLGYGDFTYIKYNDIYIYTSNTDFFSPHKIVNDNYSLHLFSLFIPIVPIIPVPGFIFNSEGFEVVLKSTQSLDGYSIGIKNGNDVVHYARNQNISHDTLDHPEGDRDLWDYALMKWGYVVITYGADETDLYEIHAVFNEKSPSAILLKKDGVTTEFKLKHGWDVIYCPVISGMPP